MIDSLIIAFATYSRIPMPNAEWNEKNMKYAMCFFPLIGVVIGALEFLIWKAGSVLQTYNTITAFFLLLVPVLLTGGIHLDGLFDTEDALHSYGDKERKLEILKDPHVGAFAVIYGVMYILGAYALFTQIDLPALVATCFGFIISRALSGYSVVSFTKAKKDGMVSIFSKRADKRVRTVLIVAVFMTVLYMFVLFSYKGVSFLYPAVVTAMAAISFFRYKYRIVTQFGGTTGDLCGYFLCNCEFLILLGSVMTTRLISYLQVA